MIAAMPTTADNWASPVTQSCVNLSTTLSSRNTKNNKQESRNRELHGHHPCDSRTVCRIPIPSTYPRLSMRERSSSFLERIRDNLMLPSCADYEACHSNGLDATLFPGTPVLESFNISLSRISSLSSIRSSTQLSTLRANSDLLASAPSAASTPVLSPRNSRQQATPTAGIEIISLKDIPGDSDSVDGQKSDTPLKLVFVTALEHRTSSDITMHPEGKHVW